MWQEIEQKHPDEFFEWAKFKYKDNLEYYQDKHWAIVNWLKGEDFRSLWGWILEFFDSKGIYIVVYDLVNSRSGNVPDLWDDEWGYNIRQKDGRKIYLIAENPDNLWYKSRPEAYQAATKKAFEILEGK